MTRPLLMMALASLLPTLALAQPGPGPGRRGAGAQARQGAFCPIHVQGAEVTTEDTATGAELTLTAPAEKVERVRQQARAMADHFNSRPAGHPPPGVGGSGMGGVAPMPPAKVTVEDVKDGARLVFEPVDSSRADELRAAVKQHGEKMSNAECPMGQPGRGPPR